jgi:hypothetical protein
MLTICRLAVCCLRVFCSALMRDVRAVLVITACYQYLGTQCRPFIAWPSPYVRTNCSCRVLLTFLYQPLLLSPVFSFFNLFFFVFLSLFYTFTSSSFYPASLPFSLPLWEDWFIQGFGGKPEGKSQFEYLVVDGRIILKRFFKKND